MSPPKKNKIPSSDMPMFIKIENDKDTSGITQYVKQVIRKNHPQLENPDALAAEIAVEVTKLDIRTLSLQLVQGFIANKITEQKPELSKEGLIKPKLTDNALTVLKKRYLKKGNDLKPIEEPYQLFSRVAKTIAAAEKIYEPDCDITVTEKRFYEMMVLGHFLPNSPTLMNAGQELGQLSACFVLPIEDSMDSIFEAVKHTAMIHKSGGGTGFSFSRLRPKNDVVRSTKGISSGPISFLNVFDAATETVKQGGTRRGANMAILRVDHPDILDFVTCKSMLDRLNNFNISVGITDEFMNAHEKGRNYDLINPRTGKKAGSLSAKKVFDLIVNLAWTNGEPGMIFIDRINAMNPTPGVGAIEATNPCGEQPLLPYESCNLGSVNLAKMVTKGKVDYSLLEKTVHDAVHFLDNVIDLNRYPLPQIKEKTLGNRKIGLGVMGWADMLVQLGIPYNSARALKLGEQVMSFVQKNGREASCKIAQIRGVFPNIEKSIYARLPKEQQPRNATVTTIAPTGTLSIIAGVSSGIEPYFAVNFYRRILDGEKLVETNPYFDIIAKKERFYSRELMEKIAASGSIAKIEEIPASIRKLFLTSHDISPEEHIKMQAAFQKFTDNAVSKTVNIPENAGTEDVTKVFINAYQLGCKGVTVYRYGSRESVLNVESKLNEIKDESPEPEVVYDHFLPRQRTQGSLTGTTDLKNIGCGKLYVTINEDEYGICELFTTLGRAGGCPSQSEATGRLISLALRCGVSLESITRQLKPIRCHSAIRRNDSTNLAKANGVRAVSCPAAIASALEERYKKSPDRKRQGPVIPQHYHGNENENYRAPEASGTPVEHKFLDQGLCPDCGEPINHAGGCVVCHSCGYSRCG